MFNKYTMEDSILFFINNKVVSNSSIIHYLNLGTLLPSSSVFTLLMSKDCFRTHNDTHLVRKHYRFTTSVSFNSDTMVVIFTRV